MTATGKIIIGVIVVVLIGLGIWFVEKANAPTDMIQSASTNTEPVTEATGSTPRDASDQSLDQDMTSVDTQINAYNSDSATADQGLNDKPVTQEY